MSEQLSHDLDIESEFAGIIKKSFPEQAYYTPTGELAYRPSLSPEGYGLGSPEFPIAKYRELIVETVNDNLLTIITAKTGAGKSTNVPQFLLETGLYDKVVVTQPRVLAARSLKEQVSANVTASFGGREQNRVGFQTAVEEAYSEDNEILYVTDGLQLMHEIAKHGIRKNQVLIIDEFHERSGNMDALLAIAVKYQIRTVVMSATLDAGNLSDYYSDIIGAPVPVIEVPGSNYEVVERESSDLDNEIIEAAKLGKNILVFLPGRREIDSVMGRVRRYVPNSYMLLPLHGDQTPDEQQRALEHYSGGKIIFSTSVGQTSITIDDLDIVIDAGYERTGTLDEDGKSTLATQPSSRATADQRRGRVGRTKDGEYVRAQLRGYPPLPSLETMAAYDVPEIQRMRTDDLQLKLAAMDETIESLPFYQRPSELELSRGRERLTRLGLFKKLGEAALNSYEMTRDGRRAAMLPVDVHSARMVLEARNYGTDIELQMMAAVAVRQLNGITSTVKGMEKWRGLTHESHSDILAGIDYIVAALRSTELEQQSKHIIPLRYKKALRAFEMLAKKRNLDYADLKQPDDWQREQLHKCIVAGSDELFVSSAKGYIDNQHKKRQLVQNTIIGKETELVVGTPFNLQQVRSKKIATHALITAGTSVTLKELQEVVPARLSTEIMKLYIDEQGKPRTEERVLFDGYSTRQFVQNEAKPSPALQEFIIEHIFSSKQLNGSTGPNIKMARRLLGDYRKLQHRTSENLGVEYSVRQLINRMIKETDYRVVAFKDVDPFIDVEAIKNIIPYEIQQEIIAGSPETITILNHDVKVTYFENKAQLTIPQNYYQLLPFVIGNNHRVEVRPNGHSAYMPLEKARDAYESPSRRERRGATEDEGQSTERHPSAVDAHKSHGSKRPRLAPSYRQGRGTY